MFSKHSSINFSIEAQKIAHKYGVFLKIDWENAYLDFQGKCSEEQWEDLMLEISDLAKLYDLEDMF